MTFIKGRELSRRFYWEAVRPLLDTHFPDLPHAAARIGGGSDVLGFDTEMSMDHDWGPRVHLLLPLAAAHHAVAVREVLENNLPFTFAGFSTHFDTHDDRTYFMALRDVYPIKPLVPVMSLDTFVQSHLNHEFGKPFSPLDWLSTSAQILAEISYGLIHYDATGELSQLQAQFEWYPDDVWYYLMAASWTRIAQEEHLMGRAGHVGDELGSSLIGSRLVNDIMFLCFLMERRYPLYPKWFGSAFQQLDCAAEFNLPLLNAQMASSWKVREEALAEAYSLLAERHNNLGLTQPLSKAVESFHERPFRVISGQRFADALIALITDDEVLEIANRGYLGSIDQFSDSTDLRSHIHWRSAVKGLLGGTQ